MAHEVTLDFTGAPPAQGGGFADHVPEGDYLLVCTKWVDRISQAGNKVYIPWFEVVGGEFDGKKLNDNFTDTGDPENNFGMQKMHACLNAFNVFPGEKKFKINLDALINKRVLATVQDRELDVRKEGQKPRTVSQIVEYAAVPKPAANTTNGQVAAPKPAAAAQPAAIAQVEPEEVDEVEDVAVASVEPEEVAVVAEAPAARVVKRQTLPASAPPSTDEEVESLFA